MRKTEKYTNVDNEKVFRILSNILENKELSYAYVGWQDGDYFVELCEEDGGVISEHYSKFKEMYIVNKGKTLNDLFAVIHQYQEEPYLSSNNRNYKFHYDIHIWSNKVYVVYNAYVKQLLVMKRSCLNRLFSIIITPDWQE
jgi:hypothetical protein